MRNERTHRPPKPIAITRPGLRNQYYPDYYTSILGASIHTGISRNTLTQAVETGEAIKKGKGKGCTVKYRNPEDQTKRLKQYQEFTAKKELAAFGLANTTEAIEELKRLEIYEQLFLQSRQKINALESTVKALQEHKRLQDLQ